MTLWQGRFAGDPSEELMAYTASVSFDVRLAPDDIAGSRAHVRGLGRAGILTDDEVAVVVAALNRVEEELNDGVFKFAPGDEDVHTAVERRRHPRSSMIPHSMARPQRFSSIEYGLFLVTLIGMPCLAA